MDDSAVPQQVVPVDALPPLPDVGEAVMKPTRKRGRAPPAAPATPPAAPLFVSGLDASDADAHLVPLHMASDWQALNEEQRSFVRAVDSREHVLLTGAGGTGKTYAFRYAIALARTRARGPDSVLVTAPTGVAALHIGGVTMHSAFGLGIAASPAEHYAHGALPRALRALDVVFIDEVSMVTPHLFDCVQAVLGRLPGRAVQFVMCGDFLQLPPIFGPLEAPAGAATPTTAHREQCMLFQSAAWQRLRPRVVQLVQPHRHAGDAAFGTLCAAARMGALPADAQAALASRLGARLDLPPGVEPTRLLAYCRDVDHENAQHLAALPGPAHTYEAVLRAQPYERFGVAEDGRRFMRDDPVLDRAQFKREVPVGASEWERLQAALPPPFALQGAVPAAARCVLRHPVAVLGACRYPHTLQLRVGAQVMLLCNTYRCHGLVNGSRGVVAAFAAADDGAADDAGDDDDDDVPTPLYPVVHFANGTQLTIVPAAHMTRVSEDTEMGVEQLPLALAWAVTVHKAQGLTLDAVAIDMPKVFAKGQAYVALSRASSLQAITLRSPLPADAFEADANALRFYASL